MSGAPRVRAVVFDLDGTLIDSRDDIAAATAFTLAQHGFPERAKSELLTYVGDGARALLAGSARLADDDPRLDTLVRTFIAYYSEHALVRTRFCAGAETALAALTPWPFALCTNKPRATTERVLAGMGLAHTFRVVVAGGDLPAQKPDPLPLEHIARELGLTTPEVAMVGDGAQDVLAGKRAGCLCIGVRGGIQPIERLLAAGPDVLIDDLHALPSALAAHLTSV